MGRFHAVGVQNSLNKVNFELSMLVHFLHICASFKLCLLAQQNYCIMAFTGSQAYKEKHKQNGKKTLLCDKVQSTKETEQRLVACKFNTYKN